MIFARTEEHLGDRIADYVDGVLDAAEEHKVEVHLTVCQHCRHAVEQERAIIAQLRSVRFDAGGHQQMMASLLSLAGPDSGVGAHPMAGPVAGSDRQALAVVTAGAPPQYQSARRSMACALFAVAGCVGVALAATSATVGTSTPPRHQPALSNRAFHVHDLPGTTSTPIRTVSARGPQPEDSVAQIGWHFP
ncbi:anti-sigma factor family protein [Rudaeicoccus suwonensis]|uniref:Putative zinc finger protein n=1 Tax=Rudaeicoccus suwonensis TaxID=657409 RepID=A0A561E1A3_9MICO|nr:zf-HC2 domain-containing protein [Rudaeicoccus suwonensis]TWE09361.1 putative zinc finger protein [Rudaeicoccus suwonensis]